MAHTVIWKYTDQEGDTKVLVGHPGAFSTDEADAVNEAKQIMTALQGVALAPLAVVETDEDIAEDVYACEEVYLGPEDDDQLFYDISGLGKWAKQKWWPA